LAKTDFKFNSILLNSQEVSLILCTEVTAPHKITFELHVNDTQMQTMDICVMISPTEREKNSP